MQLQKCIIIDDDPLSCSVLEELIRQKQELRLMATLHSSEEASAFLLLHKNIDLIFLDIDLNGSSGISLFRKLKQRPNVIFTTSHEEFALVAFELGAIDYLKKPFSRERFKKAVDRLLKQLTPKNQHQENSAGEAQMFFKTGRTFKNVAVNDILFFKGSKDYIKVVTTDASMLVLMTMQEMMTKLDSNRFIRTGKSYIVNKEHIKNITGNELTVGDNKIPLSRSYSSDVKQKLGLN